MKVNVQTIGNKILLPNYIQYPYERRFRNYKVDYELVIPETTKVFVLDKNAIDVNDDLSSDSYENYEETININGNKIYHNSEEEDIIIINDVKYHKDQGEKIIDSIKNDIIHTKNMNISIKNGNKEFSIKTK